MKSIQDKIKALVSKLSLRGEDHDTIAHQLIRRGLVLLDYKQAVIVEATDHGGLRITGPNEGFEARIMPTGDAAVAQLIGLLGVDRTPGAAQAWNVMLSADGTGFTVETVQPEITSEQVGITLREAAETFDAYARNHLGKEPPQVEKAERNVDMAEKCYAALGEAYVAPESVLLAPREPQESDSAAPAPERPAEPVVSAVAAIRATINDMMEDDAFSIPNDAIGHGFEAIDQLLDRVMLVTDADVPAYIRTKAMSTAAKAGDGHLARVLNALAEEIERGLQERPIDMGQAFAEMIQTLAKANKDRGWWTDLATGEPLDRNVGELLMLIVSEIAEAMEGHRKSLRDDHLPDFWMFEVELADAVIRICDSAGNLKAPDGTPYRVAEAMMAKIGYNAKRADHDPANRKAEGGKKY